MQMLLELGPLAKPSSGTSTQQRGLVFTNPRMKPVSALEPRWVDVPAHKPHTGVVQGHHGGPHDSILFVSAEEGILEHSPTQGKSQSLGLSYELGRYAANVSTLQEISTA